MYSPTTSFHSYGSHPASAAQGNGKSRLPILVVGNGPVGLLLSYSLAKQNIPVILITRHLRRLGVPKAHALSPRSLEILRQLGLPVSAIRRLPAHRKDAMWVQFVTNLSGKQIGHLPYERMTLDVLDASPEMVHNVSQPDLEVMIESMMEHETNVDYRKGWTWIMHEEIERDGETVCISTVEDTYTGEEMIIESSFVIGCDGANSRVRKVAGITSDGEETADTMMTIHFNADLRPVVGANTGMLHWIMDPAARGFIIAYDIEFNHVLIHNIDPVRDPISSFSPDKCMDIIRAAVGRDIQADFQCSMPWVLRRKVANEYFKGRVVLAGDSAHSFPPTGGLGLNSGIGDAHNLAFKLAAWYHGWGNLDTVLHTYEAERRPVAVRNAIQSVRNGRKIFSLLKAVKNTHPDVEVARRQMNEALADPRQMAYIQTLIADQAEHFDNLNRHIGYVYDPSWQPNDSPDYKPIFRKGARLVHAWVKIKSACVHGLTPVDLSYLQGDLSSDKLKSWQYSVLDTVPPASFVLYYSGSSWGKKANQLKQLFASSKIPLVTLEVGKDFDFTERKPGKAWQEGYGVGKGNALLVRPDQHIEAIIPSAQSSQAILDATLYSLGL